MFYTGITNDLIRRVYEHKHKLLGGFTKQYNVTKLVYFEHHTDVNEAIMREKKIKKWKRVFKVGEIEKMNPNWDDLYSGITQQSPQLATLARGDN
jgi:putative endonuclease